MSVYMPKLILFGRTRPTRGRPVTGQVPRMRQSWARLNASRLQVPGTLAELGAREWWRGEAGQVPSDGRAGRGESASRFRRQSECHSEDEGASRSR